MYTHNEHSQVFKRWCIALVVVVFILGIIAGFVFKIEKEPLSVYGYYSSSHAKSSFNWGLACIIWLSEVIPAAVLYAVYSHLENQEIQINNLNEIRKTLTEQKSPVSKTNSTQNVPSFKKFDETDNSLICPMCKTRNPIGSERCRNCNSLL